jgi:hypothetical protein
LCDCKTFFHVQDAVGTNILSPGRKRPEKDEVELVVVQHTHYFVCSYAQCLSRRMFEVVKCLRVPLITSYIYLAEERIDRARRGEREAVEKQR